MLQRAHEKRRALFSCFYWAVYSWNLEAMQSAGSPPGQAAMKAMLVSAARCYGGGSWPGVKSCAMHVDLTKQVYNPQSSRHCLATTLDLI